MQVEVETSALCEPRESTRTEDHRGQTRTSAQTLLRAAVTRIDAPLADIQRHATKRTDGIDNRQRIMLAGDSGQLAYGVQHASRRLCMNHRNDVRTPRPESLSQC